MTKEFRDSSSSNITVVLMDSYFRMEDEEGDLDAVTADVLNLVIIDDDIAGAVANKVPDDVVDDLILRPLVKADSPRLDEALHALPQVLLLVPQTLGVEAV